MSSAPSTRLAKVANERRRQRKQQQAANRNKVISTNAGSNNTEDTDARHENKGKNDTCEQPSLLCAPTSSCTFDDSTIASAGTWRTSQSRKSTITDCQSTFTDVQSMLTEESYNFIPPMTILSPAAKKGHTNKSTVLSSSKLSVTTEDVKPAVSSSKRSFAAEEKKPAVVITTPRRRNLRAYHAAKQRSVGAWSESTAPITSTKRSTIVSNTPTKNKLPTPRNNNISTPRQHNTTPKHNNQRTQQQPANRNKVIPTNASSNNAKDTDARQNDRCEQPSLLCAPTASCTFDDSTIASSDSESLSAKATPEQIMLLKLERDKLQGDVIMFKSKLQHAIDTKNTSIEEKDDAIIDLENKLQSLTKGKHDGITDLKVQLQSLSKELELSKSQTRCAKMQLKDTEQKMHGKTKLKDTAHQKELNEVEKRLGETLKELSRVNRLLKEMTDGRHSLDRDNKCLKQELREMREGMDETEKNRNESLKKIANMKLEYEEKCAQQAQREAHLEQSLQDIQSKKRTEIAESRRTIASVENEARGVEKGLEDQISNLQNELQMQRNSNDNVKRHHAKIVEGLKSDLHKSRQLRDESASSMQRDIEEMKVEYDDNIAYYKGEVDNLRNQLRSTKTRADADRKEWISNIQPEYERKLDSVMNEKEEIRMELAQARKDIECLKSVRDKDIQLLESELNKTYKAKVELEAEFKDTKRQLHIALRNLDAMTLDGGQMRSDLEGVMDDFTKEKRHYQKENDHLKSSNEDQRIKLERLSKANSQYEGICDDLRKENRHFQKENEQLLLKSCNEDQKFKAEDIQTENRQLRKENEHLKSRSEVQKYKVEDLLRENETYKFSCGELRNSVATLEEQIMGEMRSHKQQDIDADNGREVLMLEIQCLKGRLDKSEEEATTFSADAVAAASAAAEAASELSENKATITHLKTEILELSNQIAHYTESTEQLQYTQRDTCAQLSRANQTIQILKSKERYLESRVESLADQISKTVQDYEMRLSSSASGESNGDRCNKSRELNETKIGGDDVENDRSRFGVRKR